MITFDSIRLANSGGHEEGVLLSAAGAVAAVLVRLEAQGWYLLHGFGPCEREGLVFPDLESAAAWVRGRAQTAA